MCRGIWEKVKAHSMTPEQGKEYWEYLNEILVRYYDRKEHILVKIR